MLMNPSETQDEFTFVHTGALSELSMECENELSAVGVMLMVSYLDLFTFVIMLVAVIT